MEYGNRTARAVVDIVIEDCVADRRQQGDELHPGKDFSKTSPARKAEKSEKSGKGRDVGASLRSIYRETVDEDVPREMLDLLGKLD